MGRDVNNKIRNAPKFVGAITFHVENDLRYKSVLKVLVDKACEAQFNTCGKLSSSLLFAEFRLRSATLRQKRFRRKSYFQW